MDKDVERIREDFPILEHKTYLASAGSGPVLRLVWEAVKSYWGFKIQGAPEASHGPTVNQPDTRGEAAKLLHADEDELCWISRVTQGQNMVRSLIEVKRGENVVVARAPLEKSLVMSVLFGFGVWV